MNLMEMLGVAGDVIDTPGGFVRSALAGRNPFESVLDPSKRASGRDLLEAMGAAGPNQEGLDWGDVGGFGIEALLDPLNLIPGVALTKAGRAAKAAKKFNQHSDHLRAMGGMPEDVAKLTKVTADKFHQIADPGEVGRVLRQKKPAWWNGEEGSQIVPDSEILSDPEFAAMFRRETGPATVYHGTPHVFDKFEADKLADDSLYGKGVYTTRDPEIASSYTNKGAVPIIERKTGVTDEQIRDIAKQKYEMDLYNSRFPTDPKRVASKVYEEITQMHRAGNGQIPGSRAERLHNDFGHLFNVTPPAKNVRRHFMDARNPFDMDGYVDDGSEKIRDYIRQKTTGGYSGWLKEHLENDLRELGPSVTGDHAYQLLDRHVADPNQALRELGYDSIFHTGGIQGGKKHQVHIAFSPDQMYAPWVAPSHRHVPRMAPLVMALMGQLGASATLRGARHGGHYDQGQDSQILADALFAP